MPFPIAPSAFGQFGTTFLLVTAAVLIGLLAQLVIAVRDLVLGRASASWPTADGVITDARVVRRGARNQYRAALAYTYTVAGRTHHGHRRYYGSEASFGSAGPTAVAERYPPGLAITVYHHPTRPGLAVLEPGVAVTDALMRLGQAGLGLVLLVPFLRVILPAAQLFLTWGGR
jgi:hypothetical protein